VTVFASFAVTVKVYVAAVVGVPERMPVVGLSVKPFGSMPAVTVKV